MYIWLARVGMQDSVWQHASELLQQSRAHLSHLNYCATLLHYRLQSECCWPLITPFWYTTNDLCFRLEMRNTTMLRSKSFRLCSIILIRLGHLSNTSHHNIQAGCQTTSIRPTGFVLWQMITSILSRLGHFSWRIQEWPFKITWHLAVNLWL